MHRRPRRPVTDALARLLAPPGRSSATAGVSLSTDGSPGTRRRRDLPQTRLRAARGMRVRVPDGALMPVIGSAHGRRHVALTGLQRSAEHRSTGPAKPKSAATSESWCRHPRAPIATLRWEPAPTSRRGRSRRLEGLGAPGPTSSASSRSTSPTCSPNARHVQISALPETGS